jgi:hypothetical protein
MSRFVSAVGLVPFVLVIACSPAPRSVPEDKKAIPADFEIVAEYYPGFSRWKRWETTITADGKVAQVSQVSAKESRLTERDLHDLLEKVEEADFFALEELYEEYVYDLATLKVTVTRNNKFRKVSVYGAGPNKNAKEVTRFLRVWTEILRKVPSTNPEQKPELYKP